MLGVSGSVAAYKAVEVCRLLTGRGARVVPVMTEAARRFVGQATLSALASEPVLSDLWSSVDPSPHTRIAREADVVVVAPATARLVGALAGGICDDLLTAVLIATRAPVILCPAMHTEMWENAAVQENVARLRERGITVLDPVSGPLAGGDEGVGRLVEPAKIVEAVRGVLAAVAGTVERDLEGARVLISAGGTREPIDPVRFISNRSSGKQGYALAREALARGADVVLVTAAEGASPPSGSEVVVVETSRDMERELMARCQDADVVVMAAAISDFRPARVRDQKISKADGLPDLVLEATPDILSELVAARRPGQVIVGFAAETQDVVPRARAKLEAKGVDLMIANDVSAPGAGFGYDTNAVEVIAADGALMSVPLTTKAAVARAVFDSVVDCLAKSSKNPAKSSKEEF